MPDLIYCPYCGRQTVDAGPTRTYCTTCGEDVETPGQLEDLRAEVDEVSKDCDSWQDNSAKMEAERDAAKADLEKLLNAESLLLADCRAALHAVITGPVNLPARITEKVIEVHRRLL